jgi:hypothetical protein
MRRRFQFSLRALLFSAAAMGVALAIVTSRGHRQREALTTIERLGGYCHYDFQHFNRGARGCPTSPIEHTWAPRWLRRRIGDEYFGYVVFVSLDYTSASDADLEPLTDLKRLRVLSVRKTAVTEQGLLQFHKRRPRVQFIGWHPSAAQARRESDEPQTGRSASTSAGGSLPLVPCQIGTVHAD